MPPELRDASDPQSWMRRARSNLAQARAGRATADVLYDDLCFDAQQAAEKAIKAVLVSRMLEFPKTHGIDALLDLLASGAVTVPAEIREAGILTAYATHARYPGGGEDVDEAEYHEATRLAERVVRWAERMVA
ncbi:MAG: HEPN domain-containing protein [Gemmatimonadaceae bacterium]